MKLVAPAGTARNDCSPAWSNVPTELTQAARAVAMPAAARRQGVVLRIPVVTQ